jgi:hypothetical protein
MAERKSVTIGIKHQYPTNASAWAVVESLNKEGAPTVSTLIEHSRKEKMRCNTRRSYDVRL